MLIIQVLVDESKKHIHESLRSTLCPYCGADVFFDVISPVYCAKCMEVLEVYSEVETDIERRIEHYKNNSFVRSTQCFG